MKYQGNMIPPKEHNKFIAREVEIYEIFDKEFKAIVFKKLRELQKKNTGNSMKLGKRHMNNKQTTQIKNGLRT